MRVRLVPDMIIDVNELAAETTITVTVVVQSSRTWKVRMWIAGRLIDLAVWVGGFAGVDISINHIKEEND